MSSKEIFSLRKSGQFAQALELARSNHEQNLEDIWFIRAYGWALYDHIKQVVDNFENKQISITALNSQLTPLMHEFANIAQPLRGDMCFSHILRLAGKVSAVWDDFLLFAKWAGLEDFSEEDKLPFTTDTGRKIDSLEKRFARAICKQIANYAAQENTNSEILEWGKTILKNELLKFPDDQWFNYYQCKLYVAEGEYLEALKKLNPILRRQSRAAWVWVTLAEILERDRLQEAIICLVHATQLARKEQEVGRVRIKLAFMLAGEEKFEEAAYHTHLALKFREQNGYKIPEELKQLISSDWYLQAIKNNSLTKSLNVEQEIKNIILELEKENINYILGVIENINKEKALSYIATGVDTGAPLFHNKFLKAAKLKEGTFIEIGVVGENNIIDFRLTEISQIEGFCEKFQGEYTHHDGNSFAFIRANNADIFVSPSLVKKFKPNLSNTVICLAVYRKNKQGKKGWRAITIESME